MERPPGKATKGRKPARAGTLARIRRRSDASHRRLPKRGFNNAAIQDSLWHRQPRRSRETLRRRRAAINEKLLRGAGLVRGSLEGIKVLGRGEVNKKFHLEVDSISASAREKIEKAGGTITMISRKSDAGTRK
jgi:large subunit ribosomal protein L15